MNLVSSREFSALCGLSMDTDQLREKLLDYISPASNRWTAQRKVAALTLVRAQLLGAEELCSSYGVDHCELATWARDFDEQGIEGLMATKSKPRRRRMCL